MALPHNFPSFKLLGMAAACRRNFSSMLAIKTSRSMPAASNVPRVAPSVSQVPSMGLLPALVGFELMGCVASLEGEAATQQKQPAIVNNQHQTTVLVVIVLRVVVVWSCGRWVLTVHGHGQTTWSL